MKFLRLIVHMSGSQREEAAAQAVRVAIGDAIRRAYKGSPYPRQEDLAAALGMDQSNVSKIVLGKVAVNVETIERIETLCLRPHGSIYWNAGLIDPDFVVTLNFDKLVERAASERSSLPRLDEKRKARAADAARRRATAVRSAANTGNPPGKAGKRLPRPRAGETPLEPGQP